MNFYAYIMKFNIHVWTRIFKKLQIENREKFFNINIQDVYEQAFFC